MASQGRPTPAGVSNTPSNVDSPRASHMETADIVEDLMQNLSPSLSPIIWVINSTSNSSPSDNCPQDFENQIKEIDSALKKFDSHLISKTVMPTFTLTHSPPSDNNSDINADILRVKAQSITPPPHVTNQATPHDVTTLHMCKRMA